MQENPHVVSINKRSSLERRSVLNAATLMTKLSSRNLYELQVKSASYDVMMQRFQLRKVSEGNVAGGKFKHAVIDTVLRKKGAESKSPKLSPRYLMQLLMRRKTWIQLWRAISSPISPGGAVAVCHGLLMFAANQFQLFYLPFAWIYYPSGSIHTFYVVMALQFVYLLDLALNLNTSFLYQRQLVTSRWEIACHYMSKWFALELISAVPINVLVPVAREPSDAELKALHDCGIVLIMLRLGRLLLVDQRLLPTRLFQESKQLVSRFTYSRYAHLLGVAKLVWLVLVVAHYMACLWHVVAQRGEEDVRVGEQYVADFYYAVQLIQGQGTIAGTSSWRENVYSTFVILIGSGILAIVFGNVSLLISNFNANTTKYQQKMEAVYSRMEKMGLPLKLRERVHQYYAHVWSEYESLGGDVVKFQRELAHTLGLEVGLFKYMNLVIKIPFWESCSPDFATQIIRNLAVRVYLPDDYVVRKGETGDVLFMLNRGICELSDPEKSQQPKLAILVASSTTTQRSEMHSGPENAVDSSSDSTDESRDEGTKGEFDPLTRTPKLFKRITSASLLRGSIGKDKRAQVYPSNYEINHEVASSAGKADAKKQILLYPGQAFGEMSLLMNYKRTANIRAATYVEICCLDRSTFQRIISRYPEDRRHVLTEMLKNCIEKKEIPFPWDEVVDAVAERRRLKGETGTSRLNVHSAVTSTEAAEALVARIDINRPDESIKYGFQTFHPDLMGQEAAASKVDTTSTSLRQHTLGRNVSRVNAKKMRSTQSKTPTAQPIEDPRIDGMERMLGTLLDVVTTMAASIERLETKVDKGSTACCKCSPGSDAVPQGEVTTTTISQSSTKLTGEVRSAEGKPIGLAGRRVLRRSSASDVRAKMPAVVQDSLANYRLPLPRKKSTARDSVAQANALFGSVPVQEPTPTIVPTALEPSVQAEDCTEDAADSQDTDLYSIPKQKRGWLARGASQSSELTYADQLWSRHKDTRKPIGELGKSATDPRRLRSRVSTPAILEASTSAALQAHRERTNRASHRSPRVDHSRAMRRVGVDALTPSITSVDELSDAPPPRQVL